MGGCSATVGGGGCGSCKNCDDLPPGACDAIAREAMNAGSLMPRTEQVIDSRQMVNHLLLRASQDGCKESVLLCIEQGASLETRRPFTMAPPSKAAPPRTRGCGLTPLMYASQGCAVEVAKTLLCARACVNAEEEDGLAPLHFAAESGNSEMCQLLLDYRADPEMRDCHGRGAYDFVPMDELALPSSRQHWRQLLQLDAAQLERQKQQQQPASAQQPQQARKAQDERWTEADRSVAVSEEAKSRFWQPLDDTSLGVEGAATKAPSKGEVPHQVSVANALDRSSTGMSPLPATGDAIVDEGI